MEYLLLDLFADDHLIVFGVFSTEFDTGVSDERERWFILRVKAKRHRCSDALPRDRSLTLVSFGIVHRKKSKAIMLLLIHVINTPRDIQSRDRRRIEETDCITTGILHLAEFLFHVGSIVFQEKELFSTPIDMGFVSVPMY